MHCALSFERIGFKFEELHKWIDNPPEVNDLGPDHRTERHVFTVNDRNYIKEYWDSKIGSGWGDKAVIEWLFHIAIDNLSTAFKFSKSYYGPKAYNILKIGLAKSEYIFTDYEQVDEVDLYRLFGPDRHLL